MKEKTITKKWGKRLMIVALLVLVAGILRNDPQKPEFGTIDYLIVAAFLGVLVTGIMLSAKKNVLIIKTSTREDADNKYELIVRVIIEPALKRFAKKHDTSREEIATVVDHVVYQNKAILRQIAGLEPLCLNARKSHLVKDETYFELVDITIHSRYVDISYEVNSVLHTEKIKR